MVETASPLTLKIALAFGVYMIVAGPTGVVAPNRWRAIIDDFDNAPALSYLTGAFVFILGCALIFTHNIWTDALSGFVSLIGWVAAAEGLIMIAAPGVLLEFSRAFMKPALISGFAIAVTIIGGVLVFASFSGLSGR